VNRFAELRAVEVKNLTILRQSNGNRDLRTVPFSQVASPDSLADDLECARALDGPRRDGGIHFSAPSQTFFLLEDELLPSENIPAPSTSLAEIS
jgi:hypothetical protein